MSILNDIGSAAAGVLSGGITGIFGVVVQRIADYKNKQLDMEMLREKNSHEIARMSAESAMMEKEYAARTQIAMTEAAAKETIADASAFAASQSSEPARYSADVKPDKGQGWLLVVLDFIRGIVRPGLTIYLCLLTTAIYYDANQTLKGQTLSAEQATGIIEQVIGTVMYLVVTCCCWWFGTRNRQQPPSKKTG